MYRRLMILALACGVSVILSPSSAVAQGKSAAAHAAHASPPAGAKPNTTTTTPRTTGGRLPTTTVNPIATKIASKPQLNAKVTAMLPRGMTLDQASAGFKNQGQFIAALHVSRNLGIPFADLKHDMTGDRHLSLGQSIQDLKPTAHATDEAHRAETAADHDLDDAPKTSPAKPKTK